MSDEQPPEVGSRRRRREIREAREKERAAQQQAQSSVVRRLSTTSTASGEPKLFDQYQRGEEDSSDSSSQTGESQTPTPRSAFSGAEAGLSVSKESASTPDEQAAGGDDAANAHAERAARIRRRPVRRRPDAVRRAEAPESTSAQEAADQSSEAEGSPSAAANGVASGGSPAESSRAVDQAEAGAAPRTDQPTDDEQNDHRKRAGSSPERSALSRMRRWLRGRSAEAATTGAAVSDDDGAAQPVPSDDSPVKPISGSGEVSSPGADETEPSIGSAPTMAGIEFPVGAASAGPSAESPAPLTSFDEVVSPGMPIEDREGFSFGDEEQDVFLSPNDDLGEEWDELEEYIEHDEDGMPVVVSASGFGRGYQTVTPLDSSENWALYKRRQAKRRRRNITLTAALGGFVVLMIGFVVIVQQFLGTGGDYEDYDSLAGDTIEFEVSEGEGPSSVQDRLVDEGIVASGEAYQQALLDAQVRSDALHAGSYEMREEMPAADAVVAIFGEDASDPTGYFAINYGVRIDDALQEIADADGVDVSLSELQSLNEDPERFGLPEQAQNLEGFLAAGEYEPLVDASAEEILQEMVDRTLERLEDDGISDPDDQWHVITVASLITAEANHNDPDSYADIASAIENRLQDEDGETDGYLQIDASVIYGLGRSGDIHGFTDDERTDESNEYNTYANPGLPVGPIGAPVPATIDAAANPNDTNYLFWVTVDLETGETRFNETYAEHQEDVEVFEQYCEDNSDQCSAEDLEEVEEAIPPGESE